jgi:hypothetical protein
MGKVTDGVQKSFLDRALESCAILLFRQGLRNGQDHPYLTSRLQREQVMAANGMWLVNDRTGDRILLARYYPETGWLTHIDLEAHLVEAFQADHVRVLQPYVAQGSTDWRLEYDRAPYTDKKSQPLLRKKAR